MGLTFPGLNEVLPSVEASESDNILNCMYANLQSIFNKKSEIEIYIKENKIDIMFFTECFINIDHDQSEYSFPGYQNFVAMKNRGGSCMYVKNSISCYEIHPPNQTEDSCWIVIKYQHEKQ